MPVCVHIFVYLSVWIHVCVLDCVSVQGYTHLWTHKHTYLYVFMFVVSGHMSACVETGFCLCVCLLSIDLAICVTVFQHVGMSVNSCLRICMNVSLLFFAPSLFPIPESLSPAKHIPHLCASFIHHSLSPNKFVSTRLPLPWVAPSTRFLLTLNLLSSPASLPQASSACLSQSHWLLIWRLGLGCTWPFPF